jgi:hypothetical protein
LDVKRSEHVPEVFYAKLPAAGWDREPDSIAATFMAGCIFIRDTRIRQTVT